MCFSASASFVAGTALSAVGVASLRQTRDRTERPFAMIPLLFGIQQLAEGVIWLTFRHEAPVLRQAMTSVYSGFSHVIWPMYVPLAMALIEPVRWRRISLLAFEAVGVVAALSLLGYFVTHPVVAQVVGSHIVYFDPQLYQAPVVVLYLVATCGSCFVSSHWLVRVFGALGLVAFVAGYIAHVEALVSIWCFSGAVLSSLVYVHLRYGARSAAAMAPVFSWASARSAATEPR